VPPPSLEGLKGRPPPCPSLPTDRAPRRHCRSGRGTVFSVCRFRTAAGRGARTVKPLPANSLEGACPVPYGERGRTHSNREPARCAAGSSRSAPALA
jgi:hypothetical protein